MKKIISSLLILVMVLSTIMLVSCGGSESKKEDLSDSKYVGTWKITKMALGDESEDFDENWTLEIKGDGTGESIADGETDKFTWELTDKGFKTQGDIKLEFTDDGDNIAGDLFGVKLVFERKTDDESEEAAVPTRFYGGYGYMGDDPVEGAVYEYAATVLPEQYEVDKETISIPVVCIVDKVENEDGSVDVAGEYQVYNYKVDGDTLKTQSGGSHPGKIHLVKDGEFYKADGFEAVEDGGGFEESAKKIFGDKYEEFIKVESDDKKKEALRKEAIENYVQATGLKVTQYQDEGWDPVKL